MVMHQHLVSNIQPLPYQVLQTQWSPAIWLQPSLSARTQLVQAIAPLFVSDKLYLHRERRKRGREEGGMGERREVRKCLLKSQLVNYILEQIGGFLIVVMIKSSSCAVKPAINKHMYTPHLLDTPTSSNMYLVYSWLHILTPVLWPNVQALLMPSNSFP